MDLIYLILRAFIQGSIYALASIGLSLQWGVLRNLNFSHGAAITFGAYVVWFSMESLGFSYLVSFVAMLVASFLLGVAIEWLTVKPFFGKNDTNIFIATVALSSIMAQIYFIVFGGRQKVLRPLVDQLVKFGPLQATIQELLTILITAVTLIALWFILQKTKTGRSIRAVSQDHVGAILNGINTRRVYSTTLGVATMLAGIAGMLLGPIYFVSPHMGESPMVKAFIIVILGGLGSLKGTVLAAFIVAIVEILVGRYLGVTWAPISLFIIMILILIFRPQGLFGVSSRKA